VLGVTHPTRSAVALISDLANGRTLGPGGPGVEALRYGDVLSVLHSRQGLDGRGDGGQVDSTQATHVAQGHTGKVTSGLEETVDCYMCETMVYASYVSE